MPWFRVWMFGVVVLNVCVVFAAGGFAGGWNAICAVLAMALFCWGRER